jgi:hypothetical protein
MLLLCTREKKKQLWRVLYLFNHHYEGGKLLGFIPLYCIFWEIYKNKLWIGLFKTIYFFLAKTCGFKNRLFFYGF